MSGRRRASDVFVECLEAEGVRYVFGIPGEETLDLNQSLANSSVTFIPGRHEQGGAYMADMYGRLTGRAGVCLGTLGPGAMNLVTPIGDPFLHRSAGLALTCQTHLAPPAPARAPHPPAPGRHRGDPEGKPPVHRPARPLQADHEVERARDLAGH